VIQEKGTKELRSRAIYEQIPSNYIDMTIEEWYDMGIIKHPQFPICPEARVLGSKLMQAMYTKIVIR
jgi:hypothetical protein